MRGTNWIRLVLCGFVAGVVWYLLSAVFLSLFAQDFVASVERGGPHPRWGGVFFFAVDLMMGIWVMWLYSTIAPRYGAGPKTAAIAGVPVTHLAYPFGAFDETTVTAAVEAGLTHAFTCEPRALAAGDSPLRLPRLDPQEPLLERFAARVVLSLDSGV